MKSITINLIARKSSKISTRIHFKNVGLVQIDRLARVYLKQQILFELHSGKHYEIEVNQYQDLEQLLDRGLQMIMDRPGMEPRSGYRHISLLLAYLMGEMRLSSQYSNSLRKMWIGAGDFSGSYDPLWQCRNCVYLNEDYGGFGLLCAVNPEHDHHGEPCPHHERDYTRDDLRPCVVSAS